MSETRAIAAAWSGPKVLVELITSYTVFSDEEMAMIKLLEFGAMRRTHIGVKLAGVMISWPRRDNALHWFARRYNIDAGRWSSPIVAFHQLFPAAEWWRLMPQSDHSGYFTYYDVYVSRWLKDPEAGVREM